MRQRRNSLAFDDSLRLEEPDRLRYIERAAQLRNGNVECCDFLRPKRIHEFYDFLVTF